MFGSGQKVCDLINRIELATGLQAALKPSANAWRLMQIPSVVLVLVIHTAEAHEGHKPLPTRGMEVNVEAGSMVLTKAARETLDVQTVEVSPQPLTQLIRTYGSIVTPWNRHAVIASSLSGRIVSLLVRPGEQVQAGQRKSLRTIQTSAI